MGKKLQWSAVIIKCDPANTTPQRRCGWKGQEGFICGFSIFPTHRHCSFPRVSLGQSPQVSQHCKVRVQNWTLFRILLLTLWAITFFCLAGLQLPPALLVEHFKKERKRQQHDKLPPEIAGLPAFTACHIPDVAFKPPLAVSQTQKARINTALPLLIPEQGYSLGWRSTEHWEEGN